MQHARENYEFTDIWAENQKDKTPFERIWHRWEYSIKTDLRETGSEKYGLDLTG